jgi:hypothetical protein
LEKLNSHKFQHFLDEIPSDMGSYTRDCDFPSSNEDEFFSAAGNPGLFENFAVGEDQIINTTTTDEMIL